MINTEFDTDLHPMKTEIKCIPLKDCRDNWERTICTAMAGMIYAGAPDFFDDLLNKARDKENPETQKAAERTIEGVNQYLKSVFGLIRENKGDTYDAIGVAQQLSFTVENTGRLPAPQDAVNIMYDKTAMKKLGVHKPWIEWLETEEQHRERLKHEAEEQARKDAARPPKEKSRVRITYGGEERRHKIHNGSLTLSADVPNGFERQFTGQSFEKPYGLDALNNDIAAISRPEDQEKAERKIHKASPAPQT